MPRASVHDRRTNMHADRMCPCHPNICTTSRPKARARQKVSTFRASPAHFWPPGQPTETDCPYHQNELPPAWTPPTDVILYRRQSTSLTQSPDEVEALLAAGHVPVLGIATTDAFYAPAAPWVISATGSVRGLHAVVAVGIGTTHMTRRFLIRNSWGTAWAESGHAWLDDDFIVQHLRDVLVLTDEAT